MENTRQTKIANLIQQELSEIFRKQASDSIQGTLISVTKARVSPDLSISRVYLSIFPTKNGEAILKEIEAMKSQYRHALAQIIKNQVRKIPELFFHLDDSLDYIENIERELRGDGEKPTL